MREGSFILVDEVSLAEDSVLERLNSVLEPERFLALAEKGGETLEVLTAAPGWQLFATMNPGGDFGKRELSPALRNRFTEIWISAPHDPEEIRALVSPRLGAAAELAPAFSDFWCARSPQPRERNPRGLSLSLSAPSRGRAFQLWMRKTLLWVSWPSPSGR